MTNQCKKKAGYRCRTETGIEGRGLPEEANGLFQLLSSISKLLAWPWVVL